MANNPDDVRSQLLKALMAKVESDPFPSSTTMDTIEEMLTPEDVPAYARVLMDKVAEEQFPSVAMIKRLRDLIS